MPGPVNLLMGILLAIPRDLRHHRLILTATLARTLKVREAFLSTMATYLTTKQTPSRCTPAHHPTMAENKWATHQPPNPPIPATTHPPAAPLTNSPNNPQ